MFPSYKTLDLLEIDRQIGKFWEKEHIFEQSVEQRDADRPFVFYEGPPSANGLPGIHHVMGRTIKDIFCRFQTLNGYRVERKGGWDTHGLPIELAVEKELGITKEDIGKKISVDDYNHACRKTVMRYKDVWDDITRKMGYWVDLENPYITFENDYIESVWSLLKRLYDNGYLYKGYTIQPYSPAAGTGLSTHELNMPDAYRDVTDTTVVAMFKVTQDEKSAFLFDQPTEDVRIIAWTTTPWTLPSNTALTVGGKIEYVKIKTRNPYTDTEVSVVLAEKLVSKWFSLPSPPKGGASPKGGAVIIEQSASFTGMDLLGVRYEQLFPYQQPTEGDAFRVLTDDFVTTEDGTGVVHTAPSFGADDMRVAKQNGIGSLTLVDKQGKFVDNVGEFSHRYVKNYTDDPDYVDVNVDISVKLKLEGYAFSVQKYVHPYPHCWRTDKPVLYYPLDSWFIAASKAKERMFELNKTINWKPASTGEGRFGKWLENLQDWNLSRSRYWGIGLPIWRTETADVELCIGSIAQLQAEIDKANAALGKTQIVPEDLHRPYIDDIVLVTDDGRPMYRELDLIDVWFDSGSMPYAQWHSALTKPPQPPKGGSFPQTSTETSNESNPPLWGVRGATSSRAEHGAESKGAYIWATANPDSYQIIKQYAKEMRKNPTPAEAALWAHLQGKKLANHKFRRQHQIGNFIVDFVCLKKRLVLEIDGEYHATDEAKAYDKARSSYLTFDGYKVIRFTNEAILNDIDGILHQIHLELAHRPTLTDADLDANLHQSAPFGGFGGTQFPADFIAEGVDQTRGWFYTLHAIAVMCFDSVAFKNVVSNGLVLDKNGQKMSKSRGNGINPFDTIGTYGADATRWYMVSNAQPWDNLKFDLDGIKETRNKLFGTLYNTYNFFALYANVDGFEQDEQNQTPIDSRIELDRWILSKLHSLVAEVTGHYSNYEPTLAARAIESFVDAHFSNWYVRLSRRRFWKNEMSADKRAAYETMYQCLMVTGQLMSPIAPFFSDWLYKNLSDNIRSKAVAGATPLRHASVHLTDLTKADTALIDLDLEQRMDYAQRISSLILSLRKKEKIRVRQPLSRAILPILDAQFIPQVEGVKDLILAETNVKTLEYITDTSGVVTKRIKPNFKTLGKTLGANLKFVQPVIEAMTQEDIAALEHHKSVTLAVNGTDYTLDVADFLITSEDVPGFQTASDGDLTVAIDLTLTDALLAEGTARDLVNKIQGIRKDRDFNVTDRIHVTLEHHEAILAAVAQFSDYIQSETLASNLAIAHGTIGEKIDLNDAVQLGIEVILSE